MAILEDISLASEAAEIAREVWTQGTLAADNIALREGIRGCAATAKAISALPTR